MKARLAFGVLWLASARLITQDEEASRATTLLQRAVVHPGSATVDVSADGRFVAFESAAALVPADQNRSVDIYVLERSTGNVTLESVVTRCHGWRWDESSSTERGRPVPGIHVVRAQPRRPADGNRRSTGPPPGSTGRHDHARVSHPRRHPSQRGQRACGHQRRWRNGRVPIGGDRSR